MTASETSITTLWWRSVVAGVLLLGLMVVAPASAQERTRFLRWAYQDTGAFARVAGPYLPVFTISSAVLLMPSSRFDAPLLGEVQHRYRGTWGRYLDLSNELGGPKARYPLAGLFAVSLLTKNP